MENPSLRTAKEAAGVYAVQFVKEGMTVGIGTGSTVFFFIQALGKKCSSGFNVQCVATSESSALLAKQQGIPLLSSSFSSSIDLTVDGADEIDPKKNMIKGGGGALFKEKLTALASKQMIVIIDEHKRKEYLGGFPVPVEISPFLYLSTIQRIEEAGYRGKLRRIEKTSPYITDSGNYIFDLQLPFVQNPQEHHFKLKKITGVIETGFFFDLNPQVIIGYENGKVEVVA